MGMTPTTQGGLVKSSSPKLAPEVPARRGRGRFEESLEFTGGGAGTALQQVSLGVWGSGGEVGKLGSWPRGSPDF